MGSPRSDPGDLIAASDPGQRAKVAAARDSRSRARYDPLAMPSREPEPLLRASSFQVLIDDRELSFAAVSRLSSESDPDAHAVKPVPRFAPVVLRRAVSTSTELYDWRMSIVAGKDDRRDVTIRQLSAPGGSVVNAWRLVGAWPSRWSGPAFDALDNSVACEELELSFEDLVWLNPKPRITGG